MAEIFLSYARENRERIKVLVDWLEKQGWSVWWDRRIPPGKTFDQVIEEALNAARCVIVVWSKESVGSEWVKNEAEEGSNRKILVPVLFDEVRPPLGFRRMQVARLTNWNGDPHHPELESLFQSVADILGGENRQTEASAPNGDSPDHETLGSFGDRVSQPPRWYQRREVLIGGIGIVGLIVILTLMFSLGLLSSAGPSTNDHGANVNTANVNTTSADPKTSPSPPPASATTTPAPEIIFDKQIEIFNNRNTDAVENSPPNPTRFTIDNPYYITRVTNYHWNNQRGKDPTGMHLILRDEKGRDFAQCEFSSTSSAAGETPNVNWICSPNVILPAGTYTVIDPDPKTWSHNTRSGNAGFSLITGYATRTR